MNPTLARIYGTGMSKTASAKDLDLNQISAADYLSMLEESGEGKSDGLDLSQLSAAELLELAGESDDDDQIEKMASSGDLEYWDAAGRIMAHSYADEMSKVASADEIDLTEISADELLELLESGEFELEKTAGYMPKLVRRGVTMVRAGLRKGYRRARSGFNTLTRGTMLGEGSAAREYGRRAVDLTTGRNASLNARQLAREMEGGDTLANRLRARVAILTGKVEGPGAEMATAEARKVLATQGLLGAGAAGVGYAGYRKYKNRK